MPRTICHIFAKLFLASKDRHSSRHDFRARASKYRLTFFCALLSARRSSRVLVLLAFLSALRLIARNLSYSASISFLLIGIFVRIVDFARQSFMIGPSSSSKVVAVMDSFTSIEIFPSLWQSKYESFYTQ